MARTSVHDIPDELLHRVFRLLDSHDSVIRAAAVCRRWRRMASSHGLLLCWLRHDFSTCLGHYHAVDPSFSPAPTRAQRGQVAFVPASPSIGTRHFSLEFLPGGPGGRPWELVDGSGSLLLLASQRRDFFPDLVVCEPITRRFARIHPIPELRYHRCLRAVLGHRHNVISMASFTVTCVLHNRADGMEDGVSAVVARVYHHNAPPNPPDRRWRNGWHMPAGDGAAASRCIHLRGAGSAHYAGRDGVSVFWGIEEDGTVLSRGIAAFAYACVFRHFRLREHVREAPHHRSTFWFVDDGMAQPGMPYRPRLASLISDELPVFVRGEHDDNEWVLERSLCLPEATRGLPGRKVCYFGRRARIVTAGEGYVVLTPAEGTWLFSVDLRTMRVEREHSRNRFAGEVYPYELQTRPKVQACLPPCKRSRECREFCKCKLT